MGEDALYRPIIRTRVRALGQSTPMRDDSGQVCKRQRADVRDRAQYGQRMGNDIAGIAISGVAGDLGVVATDDGKLSRRRTSARCGDQPAAAVPARKEQRGQITIAGRARRRWLILAAPRQLINFDRDGI